MGNLNGDKNDDIFSRYDKQRPSNLSLESSIYPIASTCKVDFIINIIITDKMKLSLFLYIKGVY